MGFTSSPPRALTHFKFDNRGFYYSINLLYLSHNLFVCIPDGCTSPQTHYSMHYYGMARRQTHAWTLAGSIHEEYYTGTR